MRKVILFIASSLDGYIARSNGEVDWLFSEGDFGFNDFIKTVDTYLMGRKTYEKAIELGDEFSLADEVYVFSKSDFQTKNVNHKIIDNDIDKFIIELLTINGKDIWLIGGGEIIRLFLEKKYIDEIIVSIHPVLLGEGILLFPPEFPQTNLKLVKNISYPNGLLQLKYLVEK